VVNPPEPAHYIDVGSVEEAKGIISGETETELGYLEGVVGLEEYETDGWHEWRDAHDRDIEEVLNTEYEAGANALVQ
jgi:hypothetical protein